MMRHVLSIDFLACCLCGLTAAGSPARGQAVIVPDAECTCPEGAVVAPQDCDVIWMCYRTNGSTYCTNPGTPKALVSQTLNCDTCCPECHNNPPPTMTHVCTTTVSLSRSRSFDFAISPQVSGDVGAIKAALQLSFGWSGQTTYTWAITIGSEDFPSCEYGRYLAQLEYTVGTTYAINHHYSWYTRLANGFGCDPTHRWNKDCSEVRTSTALSEEWKSATGKWLGNTPCP